MSPDPPMLAAAASVTAPERLAAVPESLMSAAGANSGAADGHGLSTDRLAIQVQHAAGGYHRVVRGCTQAACVTEHYGAA